MANSESSPIQPLLSPSTPAGRGSSGNGGRRVSPSSSQYGSTAQKAGSTKGHQQRGEASSPIDPPKSPASAPRQSPPYPSPEAAGSLLSYVTTSWLDPIFKAGYRRTLQEDDIFDILPSRRAEVLGPSLSKYWEAEKQKAIAKGRKPSLLRAVVDFGMPTYWYGQVCLFIADSQSSDPEKQPPPAWQGYSLAIGLFVISMLITVINQVWTLSSTITGILIRTGLVDMIFRKATVISSKSRLDYPDGKIFNLMSTDTSRIESCAEGFLILIAVPWGTLVTVVLLWRLMGPSALLGTFILMVANPVQAWLMTKVNPVREAVSKLTDKRIQITTEILLGIKVIKFFTFEPSFLQRLSGIRCEELKGLSFLLQLRGLIYSVVSSLPVFASALSFVLYAALGNELKPEVIFPALAFFTGLRVPLLVLPYYYGEATDAYVSIKRIEGFLLCQDTEPLPPVDKNHDFALSIQDADFYWDQLPAANTTNEGSTPDQSGSSESMPEEERPLLHSNAKQGSQRPEAGNTKDQPPAAFLKDINLSIPRGSLVAIVGPVGSGKSSLLQAMVGNMMRSRGKVIRGTSIGYAAQTPWIQNATIRNNILFDTEWDSERYWGVVKACSLERDLEGMPYGDMTEIGERGVNLSGGQKARLSLARGVYYDAETIILDDPLSAVDAHVGKRIWEDCVLKELKGKTRVIATHQLHVLPDVDYVVCMKQGRIVEQGSFQELMALENGDFFKLMLEHGGHSHHKHRHHKKRVEGLKRGKSSELMSATLKVTPPSASNPADNSTVAETARIGSEDDLTVMQDSEEGELSDTDGSVSDEEEKLTPIGQMVVEERTTGALSAEIYRDYMRIGGSFSWFMICTLLALQQAINLMMNIWLSYWTTDEFKLTTWEYIDIYIGIGVLQMVFVMIGCYMLVMAVLRSSKIIHDNAFMSVLFSPMSFFDSTPMGRILNRFVSPAYPQAGLYASLRLEFSKDISTMDTLLMQSVNSCLITLVSILGVLILTATYLPWLIPAMIPLALTYCWIAHYYQSTNRELKRIDALLRSHLYSYFSETLTGLPTLRAYHQHGINNAIARNQRNLDRSNKAWYHLSMAIRWISVRTFLVGHILNLAAMVFIIWERNSISAAIAGLILSYLARLSSEMSWAIQCYASVENNMNSGERLLEYANDLEQEPPAHLPDRAPDPAWPQQGQISFRNVSLRYRADLPLVLNKISFDVSAGHKIGVVGRTGAGKSSLIQALFLLVPLEDGQIVMDGIVTSEIGMADLRSTISIIPQDPVLFQGTLRYNLDPLGKYSEQELWQVLETSDLKRYVQQEMEGGLDAMVMAQGENLSVGQRQLVCLSRALLAKSKVVVLDEATASVDLATDSLIQKAIRIDFANSTVITIAHRLNTVIDYNRILVMEQGQVAEYDTPRSLLLNPDSKFSKMVDETGVANAALLRTLAGC
ncbi:hypothetical protein BGW38_009485 [Lunasporangiospora selenospora]|uniref:Uncharacterized protein n=1 Tax=Lunasporangiospora selenospora TaxID=979761 RepID=A0A9P6KFA5_9FUNG|nr:hypothetical protein BGW38_009485 [Lunasporangiospora selenospora]